MCVPKDWKDSNGRNQGYPEVQSFLPYRSCSVLLLSHCTAWPSPSSQDCWLQFGSGEETSCTDSVLCTATQVLVPWQFFMNKKAQWAGSHCNKPCNALAVFSQLMAAGSQKEPNLGCVCLIKHKVRQHCCFFSLVLLRTFISFLQNSPEAYQRVTAYRANLEYHKR